MGRYSGKKCRLLTMIGLTTSFFIVELSVGYATNSMALVADSFHMLSDVVSIVIAFMSVKVIYLINQYLTPTLMKCHLFSQMSPKKWSKNTFGWARAEVLGALVNSVFLVALCFSILVESIKRYHSPSKPLNHNKLYDMNLQFSQVYRSRRHPQCSIDSGCWCCWIGSQHHWPIPLPWYT